jgi:hypothetical protein
MKEILIKGGIVLVDDEDSDRVVARNWFIQKRNGRAIFVYANRLRGEKIPTGNLKLHRFILQIDNPKIQVDHKNHNVLDNRKENLRLCNNSQNNANKKLPRTNTMGFKGIHRVIGKNRIKYIACIKKDRSIHIGTYETARDAALAYDRQAIELFGEFAVTNKMLGLL